MGGKTWKGWVRSPARSKNGDRSKWIRLSSNLTRAQMPEERKTEEPLVKTICSSVIIIKLINLLFFNPSQAYCVAETGYLADKGGS